MSTRISPRSTARTRPPLWAGLVIAILALAIVLMGCSSASTTTTAVPGGPPTTGGGAPGGGGPTIQVNMQGIAFDPQTVTIKVGDTVNWTNMDDVPHNATAVDNSWKTETFGKGGTGSVTFTTAGTFAYICTVHPNMTGTVIVQ